MEVEGWELFKKGQKKMKGWGLFGNKFEEAQEYFQQAGNKFKAAKVWDAAADAFMQAASCAIKSTPYEAGTLFVEAANAYRKADGKTDEAVTCYSQAVKLSIDNGRFPNAAKYEREIGTLYQEKHDWEKSKLHLTKAVDYYDGDNQSASANSTRVQIVDILIEQEQYKNAGDILDRMANSGDKGVQVQIRDYVFKAILCYMGDKLTSQMEAIAMSEVLAELREKLEDYAGLDLRFSGSREYELADRCLRAYEAGDPDQFTQAVAEFDGLRPLPDWATTILLRIKRTVVGGTEAMPSLC
jgi:alpha-soluble NSF attachment protein